MFEDENVPLAQNSEEGLDIQKPSLQSKFQTVLVKVIIPVLIFFILLILFAATVTLIAFVIFGDNIKAQSEYNVFVVGDWGSGSIEQENVAKAMDEQAKREKMDFIVSTGDHFYWVGVDNTTDPLWEKYYEQVYNTKENLKKLEWYLILGNHDWIKNPFAQIEYSKINRKWNLPSKWHVKELVISGGHRVQYIFMDTSPFSALEHHRVPKIRSENPKEQTNWLRNVLSKGTYRWRFVIGHHPFYSSGTYGDFGNQNMTEIEGILNEFKIDGYYNGHQHILEHTQTKKNGFEMNFFTSGAGGQTISNHIVNPNHPLSKFVVGKQEGYMAQKITKDFATTSVYNKFGQVIYNFTITKS